MTTATAANAAIRPGFAEPVIDAQATFRALMNALSFPGRSAAISALAAAPAGWPRAMAAAALTLLDADTPAWLDDGAGSPQAKAFLRFHTGAPIVERPDAAAFAFVTAPDAAPYADFRIGVDQYPDRSATLLVAVPSLGGGAVRRLTGPGIKDARDVAPAGDLAAFWAAWARNGALYPLGYDAFLFDDAGAIGLPRGVKAMEI